MKKPLVIFAVLVAFSAHAAEPAAPDAVEIMKGTYVSTFSNIPPSRKCSQADAKGVWKSLIVLKSPAQLKTAEQQKSGAQYLGFGEYNKLVSLRTPTQLNAGQVMAEAPKAFLQYIMTAAGMLYIYQDGKVQSSNLCFISTEASKTYAKGLLMLAVPVEKDKPLSMTLFEPVK